MRRSRKRGSGSGPFLMEMILVTGFFIICASICVLVFARANRMSQQAADINRAVLEAQTLAEEMKAGVDLNLGTVSPSRGFSVLAAADLTEEQKARWDQIRKTEDYSAYLPAWDADWNRYADAGALAAAGKKLTYMGGIYSGTVDHMRMTEIWIVRYEKQGKNRLLFHLSTDSYIEPKGGSHEQK